MRFLLWLILLIYLIKDLLFLDFLNDAPNYFIIGENKNKSRMMKAVFIIGLAEMALGLLLLSIPYNGLGGQICNGLGLALLLIGGTKVCSVEVRAFYKLWATCIKNSVSIKFQNYGTMSEDANTTNAVRSTEDASATINLAEQGGVSETLSEDNSQNNEENKENEDEEVIYHWSCNCNIL